jgi:hypothetical protein
MHKPTHQHRHSGYANQHIHNRLGMRKRYTVIDRDKTAGNRKNTKRDTQTNKKKKGGKLQEEIILSINECADTNEI